MVLMLLFACEIHKKIDLIEKKYAQCHFYMLESVQKIYKNDKYLHVFLFIFHAYIMSYVKY